jgi:hypothetical protein
VSGDLTPADAAEIGKLIDSYVKAFETAELSERLERLEGMTICSSQAPTAGLALRRIASLIETASPTNSIRSPRLYVDGCDGGALEGTCEVERAFFEQRLPFAATSAPPSGRLLGNDSTVGQVMSMCQVPAELIPSGGCQCDSTLECLPR